MKKIIIILFIITLNSNGMIAQSSINLEWSQQEVSNTTTSGNDKIPLITTDLNNNVFVAGQTASAGASTGFLTFKYDETGNLQWRTTYDLSGPENIVGSFIDNSGNIIVGGNSRSSSGFTTTTIIKYSPIGDTLWTFRYRHDGLGANGISTIFQDSVGDIFAIGSSNDLIEEEYVSHLMVLKISPNGEIIWVNKYNGGEERNYSSHIGRLLDDKIVVFGNSIRYSPTNIPFDPKRVVHQVNLEGESITSIEKPHDITWLRHYHMDNSGNTYIGYQAYKYQVLKIDKAADIVYTYEKPITAPDPPSVVLARLTAITSDGDRNIYAVGSHYGGETNTDIVTTKLDRIGNVIWEQRYTYEDVNLYDNPEDIQVDEEYVYVVGNTFKDSMNNDMVLIIYDRETGEEVLSTTYDNHGWKDTATSVLRKDNNLYVTGVSFQSNSAAPEEIVTLKYNLDFTSATASLMSSPKVQIFPNPTTQYLSIQQGDDLPYHRLQIFDVKGQLIRTETIKASQVELNISDFENGVYFINLFGKEYRHQESFIKQK